MKWWRVLVVVLAFGLATTLLLDGGSPRIVNIEQRPVVIATLPCNNRLQATSSGFVIDDQTVVTVAHALYESRDFGVRDASGEWHDAAIVYLDLERDLAVLHVPDLRADRVLMRVAEPGEAVRMIQGAASGTTKGNLLRRVRITTEVIGDLDAESQRSGYELTVEIAGGDSGAGVVDGQGNLVGLIFARSKRRDAAWATSVTEIQAIESRQGVPAWDCAPDVDADLLLEPVESVELPGAVVN